MIKKKKFLTKLILAIFCLIITEASGYSKSISQKIDIEEAWNKALKLRESYKFSPLNFDPFKPFIIEYKPAPIAKNITVFLNNYDISELKLVGIIKKKNEYIAIIEDPSGKGFFLKKGDYLGKQGGEIIKITSCAVYITQKFIDYRGRIVQSKKPLILTLSTEGETCTE
ncbi:pilus assembly protein PilP [Thermodesulfatator atlanticus]|uniref:pilus assembly protein PilP n=1 Tax=Thermodesulfatator atlanticus TaxID=501497 RepID=UPI0003B34E00|nr:pilus assembly protein PilP [Thermodesulfatator atlanticus]